MNKLKIRGINYDAGVGLFSRSNDDNNLTGKEMTDAMRIIKNELHCNAVRIYGYDLDKLIECSKIALKEGLEVWFSPRFINASAEEMHENILECSVAAEHLRKNSPDLVYVIGNELTLDARGFIEGDNIYQRIAALSKPFFILKIMFSSGVNKELNEFLQKAVGNARRYFKGNMTYASGEWERVNWDLFDIIGINYYKNIFNAWKYRWMIRKYISTGKKLAITEFGCCSYRGAEKKGAWGYSMIDWGKIRPQLKKFCERDESIQSNYIINLLNIYSNENVYAAFIYTYIARRSVSDPDPLYDLDMANFGLIKVLPSDKNSDIPYQWERKKAFYDVSEYYSDK